MMCHMASNFEILPSEFLWRKILEDLKLLPWISSLEIPLKSLYRKKNPLSARGLPHNFRNSLVITTEMYFFFMHYWM